MKDRVDRIYHRVEGEVDVIAFANAVEPHLDRSFFYVTDLVGGGLFEGSVALAWPDGHVELVTSPLEEPSVRHGDVDEVVVGEGEEGRREFLEERLAGLDAVGINGPEIVHGNVQDLREAAPDAHLVDVGDAVRDARLVKDEKELERMERAADIASEVARGIPELLEEGARESEVAADVNHRMQRRGATGPSFDTIVAFGEGAAEPHYSTGAGDPLRRGELALCDFGAIVERYVSDLTRTFVVGDASDEQRHMYETVLEAQEAALDAIAPGVQGGDVHEAAADVIDATRWEGRFIHSVGHSIGLAVHDGGALHPRRDLTLEESMVFTVEPGVYVPGVGGVRIEDDVVVTSDGVRSLTDAPKDWDFAQVG